MTLKNGFKEFLRAGLIYGTVMGLYIGLTSKNILLGIIMAVFAGALFAGSLYMFLRSVEKKFEPKRCEIAKEHKIICDGLATYKNKNGWLFFTDEGLEFHPRKFKHLQYMLHLPNTALKSTKLQNNKLIVSTIDDKVYEIAVVKNNEWKNQIDGFFGKHSENS